MLESQFTTLHRKAAVAAKPAIITTDALGMIIGASDGVFDVSGFKARELLGREISTLLHQDMPADLRTEWSTWILSGKTARSLIKCATKDGTSYWRDAYALPQTRSGSFAGARIVLLSGNVDAEQRAEKIYGNWNELSQQYRKNSTGILAPRLLALITLPTLLLSVSSLWYSSSSLMLLSLIASVLCGVMGWKLLAGLRQLTDQALALDNDPLMCYLHTGGVDEVSRIRYALDLGESQLRAMAACISHSCDNLQHTTLQHELFVAQSHLATYQQSKAARAVDQAMRSILDDQHHTTCSATRTMQFIFDSHQAALEGRKKLDQLATLTRHQLHQFEQADRHGKELSHRSQDIAAIIDTIKNSTEDIHPKRHHRNLAANDQTHPVVATRENPARISLISTSIDQLNHHVVELCKANQGVAQTIESGIQTARQTMVLADTIDQSLQTIIGVLTRINTLAVDVDNAMHHQSITRAATGHHIESLQANAAISLQANRDLSVQAENLQRQLTELQHLASNFMQTIERVPT